MNELQILHIADVHLGGSGPAFGDRVREHQQRLHEAFVRCTDLALSHHVKAVCIAGDLFDSPRPSERTVQMALQQLRRLSEATPPVHCFLLPGNHDCLDEASVYRRPGFQSEFLHTWAEPGPATVRLPDATVAIHGNPQPCGSTQHRPLEGIQPDPQAGYNVALAHGANLIPDITEDESTLITDEDIAGSGMDYIALGHWHDPGDYSSNVPAVYCGAPEIVSVGQKQPGGAVLVTLSETGVRWERIEVGVLRWESVELHAEEYPHETAIETAIGSRADPNLLLDVTVSGLSPEGFTCDPGQLEEELAGAFFRLRITDRVAAPLEELPSGAAEGQLIAARVSDLFRKRIQRLTDEGKPDEERIARRALQLSLALLGGKDVLP